MCDILKAIKAQTCLRHISFSFSAVVKLNVCAEKSFKICSSFVKQCQTVSYTVCHTMCPILCPTLTTTKTCLGHLQNVQHVLLFQKLLPGHLPSACCSADDTQNAACARSMLHALHTHPNHHPCIRFQIITVVLIKANKESNSVR